MGLAVLPAVLSVLLLAVSITATPVNSGDNLVVSRKFFLESSVKYTSQHDIVNLLVPLNRINFDDDADDDTDDEDTDDVTVFFTEADVDDKGDRQYKGLYALEDGKATEVLANGRDAAALGDDSKRVYIGAADGIYVYEDGTTKKYGTLSDSIIQIEADNQTGTVYFLTEDHQLFSAADEGTTKIKLEDNVREFAIDYACNIYYYDVVDKHLHVFNQDGDKKFQDLATANALKLVRPMFAQDRGVFAVVDKKLYLLNPNGTSTATQISFEVIPTACAPDATLLQYYALDKKIYEFNVIELLASEWSEVKEFLNDKKDDIQTIATKSRSAFGIGV